MKTYKIINGDISDGYHTFDELYEHRVLLFLALAKQFPGKAFYREPNLEWFILFLELPTGQISYHIPLKYLDHVAGFATYDRQYLWDCHVAADVVDRLERLVATGATNLAPVVE